MSMWAIEYRYDEAQDQERAEVRPEHRAYLASLMDAGVMLAYGRFDDDGAPGALLLAEALDANAVEAYLADDPYMRAGLVGSHTVRPWAGIVRG